jgi:hypothetical protein
MNTEELKLLLDRFASLCCLYESVAHLSGEHEPQTIILENLNEQFRHALDALGDRGLLS